MGKGNFSDNFKHDAVMQINERGYPVAEVSQRLDVSPHSLYAWNRKFSQSSVSGGDDKYAFVAEHRPLFPVRSMCRCLCIQPSGFYAWLKNPLNKRAREDARQTELIRRAWKDSGKVDGYRKLHDDLLDQGEACCPNRVARLPRQAGTKAQIGYKHQPGAYGGRPSMVIDNTPDRQFDVEIPDRAWVTDIAYIRTLEGFGYLAVVIDLYSHRLICWSMQSRQTTDVVLQALLMAVWRRKPKTKILIHSDQGSQFTSMDWASFLRHHNLEHSMAGLGTATTMRWRRVSSTYSGANGYGARSTKPEPRPATIRSISSRCSSIRSASISETGCCRPSSSKGRRKSQPRAPRKLGAIQSNGAKGSNDRPSNTSACSTKN